MREMKANRLHKEPTIETYREKAADDWPDFPWANLTITHHAGQWHGTFEVVLRAALSDALSDGEPLDDVILVEEGSARYVRNVWTGTVTHLTPTEVVFYGNIPVEIDRVLAVSF